MSDGKDIASGGSFCEVVGCSGEGTTTRWVITEAGGKREIHVCWKHKEGEVTESDLASG